MPWGSYPDWQQDLTTPETLQGIDDEWDDPLTERVQSAHFRLLNHQIGEKIGNC